MQEDLPRSYRSGGAVTAATEGVGITSLSFNSQDPTVFVVGVEGGSVLLCSTSQQVKHTGGKSDVAILSTSRNNVRQNDDCVVSRIFCVYNVLMLNFPEHLFVVDI